MKGFRCHLFPKAIETIAARCLTLALLIPSVFPLSALPDAIHAGKTETKVLIKAA